MLSLNVFDSDQFGLTSLSAAVRRLPVTPSKIGRMLLFKDEPVSTLTVAIQRVGGRLVLIPTAARGTMPNLYTTGGGSARIFRIPHIPLNAAVMADDVTGLKDLENEGANLMQVAQLVNQKLEGMKQSMEATWEWHRIGALHGSVKDADGTTELYNLFTEFGVTETSVDFDFSDPDLNVKATTLSVIQAIEDALGSTTYDHVHAMCGDNFFAHLMAHEEVREAFKDDDNFVQTQQTPVGGVERGITYGNVVWENYRGKVGAVNFVDTDTARFFPMGVPDLFKRFLAPAEFEETVNTLGKDLYSKQRKMPWDVGVELHIQSNPLFMCDTPAALVKGADTGTYA